jgi:hypothetical protein
VKTPARSFCAAALSPSLLRNSKIAVNSIRLRYIRTPAHASPLFSNISRKRPEVPSWLLLLPFRSRLSVLELLDDFLRNRMALRLRWLSRYAHRPHTLLQAFHRQRLAAKESVLYAKTAGAPLRDARLDADHVPKRRRNEKIAARLYQRNSGDLESLQHFGLRESQRLMKQRIGAGIEIFKVTREKHNSKRVAVAPLNEDLFSVCQHSLSRLALPIGSAESTPLFHSGASHLLFLCAFTVDCLRGNTIIP